MKNALAIFQGRAPLVVESATLRSGQKQKFELAAFRVAQTSTALLSQKIDGVVPPNDPACR
jgi:hypothetical protein